MNEFQRASLQALANGLNVAVTLTVKYLAPDIPNDIVVAWMGVFAAAARFAENLYDVRHAPQAAAIRRRKPATPKEG